MKWENKNEYKQLGHNWQWVGGDYALSELILCSIMSKRDSKLKEKQHDCKTNWDREGGYRKEMRYRFVRHGFNSILLK